MGWYCVKCKELHSQGKLCRHHAAQLKDDPSLLAQAGNFLTIAGQHHLVTSQSLDEVASSVNKLAGTNLIFKGTHLSTRDVQVFRQLNVDPYSKSQIFSNGESAKTYIGNATKGQADTLTKKLNGTGQEVDWLRMKQGRLSSLWEKPMLLGETQSNYPGVDGVTINRFTGRTIERTTIKAAESSKGLGTNIADVLKALENGTLSPDDAVHGVPGTKNALQKALGKNLEKAKQTGDARLTEILEAAKKDLKVTEMNDYNAVKASSKRLTYKISEGKAVPAIAGEEVFAKATQGALIGAAVALTVSGLSCYLRYKNGEIDENEAFDMVAQDTLQGSLVGGVLGGATLYLPPGAIGVVAGFAIGVYVGATCQNLLDELFGKGEYGAILDACGYVYGVSVSLDNCVDKLARDDKDFSARHSNILEKHRQLDLNQAEFDRLMDEG